MTARPVEAVFFWRFSAATFKAVYGRKPNGTTYTKDFFQSPGAQFPVIDQVMQRPKDGEVPLEYRWPGGARSGTWRMSAADPRGQMAWEPISEPPTPWRIGDSNKDPTISLDGDPTKTSEIDANKVFEDIVSKNQGPWFLAVKLRGEQNVLYPRVCFQDPPPHLKARSVAHLPAPIRKAIKELPVSTSGGAVVLTSGGAPNLRAPELVRRVLSALETDTNVLLIGPPGTGKTVAMEDLEALFKATGDLVFFDPASLDAAWGEGIPGAGSERKSTYLVFHPSYEYEEFVAGLVPVPEAQGFRLEPRPGAFLSMAHWTTGDRRGLMLIDEFNRGNAAAIFGDMLPLLDSSKRRRQGHTETAVLRPYSQYEMKVDPQYADEGGNVLLPPTISLSHRLWIVAALNSTDRSVAPLDAALRRRFAIIPVEPDYGALAAHWGISLPAFATEFSARKKDFSAWTREEIFELALRMLFALNQRITFVMGPDFLLGQALLWPVQGTTTHEVTTSLARAVDERVSSTLRLNFVDQDDSLAVILNAGTAPTPETPPKGGEDVVARWNMPPPAMAEAAARLEISRLAALAPEEAWRALLSLL